MTLKKFHGNTVEEARQKAREVLGQTCIVVETKAPVNNELAWIHVLDEQDTQETNIGTYSRRDLFPKALTKLKDTVNEGLQLFNLNDHSAESVPQRSALPRAAGPKFLPEPASPDKAVPDLAKEFHQLSHRFEHLEQLVSEQLIGAHNRYVSHPAFQQLLGAGVPAGVIRDWFNELIEEGTDPFDPRRDFSRQLAKKVKQLLDIGTMANPADVILFGGMTGAGKSSLMMKLTLDKTLLAPNKRIAFVSIARDDPYFYSPLPEFAFNHDQVHFMVERKQDLHALLEKEAYFDHILIEMPIANQAAKREALTVETIQSILADHLSVETHFVLNATLQESCLQAPKSFSPDYLDFTHLDEIDRTGHLFSVMQQLGCNIRYMVSGDEIREFNPAHFARQLLSNT